MQLHDQDFCVNNSTFARSYRKVLYTFNTTRDLVNQTKSEACIWLTGNLERCLLWALRPLAQTPAIPHAGRRRTRSESRLPSAVQTAVANLALRRGGDAVNGRCRLALPRGVNADAGRHTWMSAV